MITFRGIKSEPVAFLGFLILPFLCIKEIYIKIKINLNFYLQTYCGASKGFMKAFNAFMKPFEAPQGSLKIKIQVIFFSSSGIGTGRVKL